MAKYKAGDIVVLTADQGGKTYRIERVLPPGNRQGFQYAFYKPNGTKLYGLKESDIAGLYGEVDPRNLPSSDGYNHAKGQALALAQAERYDGTPDGDRWLYLAGLQVGDTITIEDELGNRNRATLVKILMDKKQRKLLSCPFVAKNFTGGIYKWRIRCLHVPK